MALPELAEVEAYHAQEMHHPVHVACPMCKSKISENCKETNGVHAPDVMYHPDRIAKAKYLFQVAQDKDLESACRSPHSNAAYWFQSIPCPKPSCKAQKFQPCLEATISASWEGAKFHTARIDKLHQIKGVPKDQKHTTKYYVWPNANDFPYWGCFPFKPQGGGSIKPRPARGSLKKRAVFPTYEAAKAEEGKIWDNRHHQTTVMPMLINKWGILYRFDLADPGERSK